MLHMGLSPGHLEPWLCPFSSTLPKALGRGGVDTAQGRSHGSESQVGSHASRVGRVGSRMQIWPWALPLTTHQGKEELLQAHGLTCV